MQKTVCLSFLTNRQFVSVELIGTLDFIKTSLPSPVLQAFENKEFMELNIEEAENLLRIFGARFDTTVQLQLYFT